MIRIVDKDGKLLPDPFLDIQALVKTDFLEQGLLGLAFSPGLQDQGLFYVYYSDYQTNGDHRARRVPRLGGRSEQGRPERANAS